MSLDDRRPIGPKAGTTIALVLTLVLATGPAVGLASPGGSGAEASVAGHGEESLDRSDERGVDTAQINGSDAEGENRTGAAIVQEAARSYANVTGFSATQVTNASYGDNTTNTAAQFYYRKPNDLRINYTAPASQAGTLIVANGSSTVIYNATNNTIQVIDTPNVSGQSTGYLAGIERTLRASNVSYEGTATVAGRETYVLSTSPAGNVGGGEIDRTYYLDQETYIPVKQHVESTFTFDNETITSESTTIFRDLEMNPDIPDATFDFEPPAGATVLESPIDYTQYDSIDAAQENVPFEIREPADVPEEYDLGNVTASQFGNTTSVSLTYTNGSGGSLLVSITPVQENRSLSAGDNSSASSEFGERISIGDREGTYIASGPQASVLFPCGEFQYSIGGPIDKEELVAIAESVPCEAAPDDTESESESESEAGEGTFSETIEIEFGGIELSVGPPEDPDDDGVFEDVTGDESVDAVDALAHAAVVASVEDGDLTLTDEQIAALDIDGDDDLTYEDARALLPEGADG
jgi:outer membrane lipoprotein-sorting protein